MEHKESDFIIKQGLDEENFILLWPISEWLIGVTMLGLFISFRHLLFGLVLFLLSLYLFQNCRNEERGSKLHYLWKLNLWVSKKGLNWSPPAHATRFDN